LINQEVVMGGPRLTQRQKETAFRLRAAGVYLKDIAHQLDCDLSCVSLVVRSRRSPVGVADPWTPRASRLSVDERELILAGLARAESLSSIARSLSRSPSTISREVKANGGQEHYSVWASHHRARDQTRRPKPAKLSHGPLLTEVSKRLGQLWSPQEISQRLPLDYPDDPEMRVSHETIYQSLYVQGRGELRRELARCLRSGRTRRKSQTGPRGGKVTDMVMISDRPAEVEDRAVPGHWEGDLILGAGGRSAVGTLVERSTRLTLLLHLPDGRTGIDVEKAMRKAVKSLPRELSRSITWDQGVEMCRHLDFSVKTGIPIYFCDPHAPWQRGSNENTNGLLRQYMPKGTDLTKHSAADLRKFQRSLNGCPRQTLGYMTPLEKFTELVALTN
jgi:IS30 family transposase